MSALEGELGRFDNPDGSFSTERSITVTDPRLNDGKPTNIPTLVKGQSKENIERILSGDMDEDIEETAILRAIERVKQGQKLPSYSTIEEAVKAAMQRSENK